jgi:hypothetical protein
MLYRKVPVFFARETLSQFLDVLLSPRKSVAPRTQGDYGRSDCRAKQNAPDSFESRDAIVEQSSPENCSHIPYVLIPIGAITRRNAICVT